MALKKSVMKRKTKAVKKASKVKRAVKSVSKAAVKTLPMKKDLPVIGYTDEIYKVSKIGNRYLLINTQGEVDTTAKVGSTLRKKAGTDGNAVRAYINKNGKKTYRGVDIISYENAIVVAPLIQNISTPMVEIPEEHAQIVDLIHKQSMAMKPKMLFIQDLKWKYLVRSAVRAKNIMMTGPAGCGKTLAAKTLVTQLNRPDYYFNLGSTQDPRSTLIGNTQFNKETGTYFSESAFVKAIKTENAIVLLDELTRAHPDAWNILMTVLDQSQRYLRLDEAEGSPIVNVADGVTFIATANIGNEYTATRVLDRALLDRFVTIEMDVLNTAEETELLTMMFPDVSPDELKAIAEIAHHTREVSKSEIGKLSTMISTRASVEFASLIYDGFSLIEAAEVAVLPFFSKDGGLESERTYVRQLVQKYIKSTDETLFNDVKDDTDPVDGSDNSTKITW